jgi:hypothetical protein
MRIFKSTVCALAVAMGLTSCGGGNSTPTTPTPATTRIISLSGNLAFGNVTIGQSTAATLTITNSGTSTLTISGLSLSSSVAGIFVANWTSGTIAAGGAQQVAIQFVPAAAQTYAGTITVTGDQTSGSNTISVSGTGAAPSTFALCGTVRKATNGEGVRGVRIEFLDGANAGKNATTDSNGSYCINQVAVGVFKLRASRSDYVPLEQTVTISADTTLNIALKEVPNAAPMVTVIFDGPSACTPQLGRPCTLNVHAQASDPDEDPLHYVWSGCATGTDAHAVCTVLRPGPVVASVDVTDEHGHTVRGEASGVGGGVNHPPMLQIGYIAPLRAGSPILELLGNVFDVDEAGETCGQEYCVSVTATGVCRSSGQLNCSCLAGLDTEVMPTAASGVCTVTFTLKDSWGQVGTPSVIFDVASPKPWVIKQQ